MKPVGDRQSVASDREVLAGLVERVTFHNPENGFCVLRTKARGHRDLVTIVGHAAMVSPGEWITASGEWNNDRTHGQQFKARFLRISAPSSVEGIEKYLGSGMIRGIGPVYQPVEKGVIDRVSRHGEAYRGEGGFAILRDDEDDLNDQDGSSGRNKHEQGANSARHGLLRGAGADELAHQQR